MRESEELPSSVLAVVNDVISRYGQTEHASAVAAVTWKSEVAVPAIQDSIREASATGEIVGWSLADAEAAAVGLFDSTLGFRTYRVGARAYASGGSPTFAPDEG